MIEVLSTEHRRSKPQKPRDRNSFPCLNIDLFILLHLQLVCSFLRCMQMWKPTWILSLVHTAFQPQSVSFSCLPLCLPLLTPSGGDLPRVQLALDISCLPSFINSFRRWPPTFAVGVWYLSRAPVKPRARILQNWRVSLCLVSANFSAKYQRADISSSGTHLLSAATPILPLQLESRPLQLVREQAWLCACQAIFTVSWSGFTFSPSFLSTQFPRTEHFSISFLPLQLHKRKLESLVRLLKLELASKWTPCSHTLGYHYLNIGQELPRVWKVLSLPHNYKSEWWAESGVGCWYTGSGDEPGNCSGEHAHAPAFWRASDTVFQDADENQEVRLFLPKHLCIRKLTHL